jgi:hypothetical protein
LPKESTKNIRRITMNKAIMAIVVSGLLTISLVGLSCALPAYQPAAVITARPPSNVASTSIGTSVTGTDEQCLGAMQAYVWLIINEQTANHQQVPQFLYDATKLLETTKQALLDLDRRSEETYSIVKHCLMANELIPGYIYDTLGSIAQQRQQIINGTGSVGKDGVNETALVSPAVKPDSGYSRFPTTVVSNESTAKIRSVLPEVDGKTQVLSTIIMRYLTADEPIPSYIYDILMSITQP